jgi:hypothetical protein
MNAASRTLGGTVMVVAIGALAAAAGGADRPRDAATDRETATLAPLASWSSSKGSPPGPAGLVDPYMLRGTSGADSYEVEIDGSRRFVVRSRNGPITPISPPAGCRVDDETQVSCDPGLIKSVIVRLSRGRDLFVAKRNLRLAMLVRGGASIDKLSAGNKNATLIGQGGADRLTGGRGNDLLAGGRGRDVLDPGAGTNVVRGGRGFDICIDRGRADNTYRECEAIR